MAARGIARGAAAAAMVGAALLAPHAPAVAASTSVTIEDYSYRAPEATVAVGDTVTWTNRDGVAHDVRTDKAPVAFASPLLKQGQTFSIKLTEPGVYEYFCSPHPHMVAKIVVK